MDDALQVTFNNPIQFGKKKELFIAPEGLYSGQVSFQASLWERFRLIVISHNSVMPIYSWDTQLLPLKQCRIQ